jgi:hypothetical protein
MNRGLLYYLMIPLLLLLSLLQSTTVARFKLAGVKPDSGAAADHRRRAGLRRASGVLWAFIAGLGMDIFSGGPIGGVEPGVDGERAGGGVGTSPASRASISWCRWPPRCWGRWSTPHVYLGILACWRWPACRAAVLPLLDTVRDIVLPVTCIIRR